MNMHRMETVPQSRDWRCLCKHKGVTPNPETGRLGTPGTHSPQSSKGTGEGEDEGGVSRKVTSQREPHSQGATPEGGDDFTL